MHYRIQLIETSTSQCSNYYYKRAEISICIKYYCLLTTCMSTYQTNMYFNVWCALSQPTNTAVVTQGVPPISSQPISTSVNTTQPSTPATLVSAVMFIVEHLSVRQLILHWISPNVCVFVLSRFRNAINTYMYVCAQVYGSSGMVRTAWALDQDVSQGWSEHAAPVIE